MAVGWFQFYWPIYRAIARIPLRGKSPLICATIVVRIFSSYGAGKSALAFHARPIRLRSKLVSCTFYRLEFHQLGIGELRANRRPGPPLPSGWRVSVDLWWFELLSLRSPGPLGRRRRLPQAWSAKGRRRSCFIALDSLCESARCGSPNIAWDLLHPVDRVPVEGLAQRPAAEEHGARLHPRRFQ